MEEGEEGRGEEGGRSLSNQAKVTSCVKIFKKVAHHCQAQETCISNFLVVIVTV